ncbi:MAG: hypothetical protein WC935_00070 [Thermoleophilia bacterium]
MAKVTDAPRIEFLVSAFGNSKGEVARVVSENATEVGYVDGLGRACFLYKFEEGISYRYIARGERANNSLKPTRPKRGSRSKRVSRAA